eukprot:TRINITY_DN5068_c0_g1_i1.p1 TRINITY_DN5068_c0_g1~~TRINITY_DN5068_c0_g1_i1.p1  ORF type:complete len:185 (-),score=75.24 TRINITY_DN5068_c0_g1_i1:13-567(-)
MLIGFDLMAVMGKMIRWFAHVNGASVMFMSTKNDSLVGRMRSMLGHYLFSSNGPRKGIVIDHGKALYVHVGTDTLGSIGSLPSTSEYASSPEELWRLVFEERFPVNEKTKEEEGEAERLLQFMEQFGESKVDQMRKQKDEELDRWRKESERRKKIKMERAKRSALGGGKGKKGKKKKAEREKAE